MGELASGLAPVDCAIHYYDGLSRMRIDEHLYTLLTYNVSGDRQLKPRWIGFRAELELGDLLSARESVSHLLRGGIFLPVRKGANPLDKPVYFTVIPGSSDKTAYIPLYEAISGTGAEHMFLVTYNDRKPPGNWRIKDVMGTGARLPVPELQLYNFRKRKFRKDWRGIRALTDRFRSLPRSGALAHRTFAEFEWRDLYIATDHRTLADLYVERLVFDGYLGFGVEKGIPADIDAVVVGKDGRMFIVEVKEKDLSKRPPQGFGMDIRRRDDLEKIQNLTGLPVFYVVREVHEQRRRKFKSWKIISLNKYIEETVGTISVEGGTGMRSINSSNPTSVCPVEKFQDL